MMVWVEQYNSQWTSCEEKYKKSNSRKTYMREYMNKWDRQHPEQIKKLKKKYRQNHKEQIKERAKSYYQKHKEQRREYQKKYRQAHK